MRAILKLLANFIPGGWIVSAASWGSTALAFCKKHWKLVLAIVVSLVIFFYGFGAGSSHQRKKDAKELAAAQEKFAETKKAFDDYRTQRETADAIINATHEADVQDVKNDAKAIEDGAKKDAANRKVAYDKIKKELEDYVANHSKPAAPGSCPADTDIGADGVRLINAARAARFPGAGAGH